MVIAFLFFLLAFTVIGVLSATQSRSTHQDYYLANCSIKPWLVGLSAVATNNSGYMFIGVIGYTYTTGLAAFWVMLGWISGDFIASAFIHHKLHLATLKTGQISYASVLSHWNNDNNLLLRRLIGLISMTFLLTYAGAQLVAGSKALHVLLDWPLWGGAVVGTICVILYCLAGGIRASIWTDAAQSFVMLIAMSTLLFVATDQLGGMGDAIQAMNRIPGFMNWFPEETVFPGLGGAVIFALSWLFAGFSVIGQPHIMTRFMTLNDNRKMLHARCWYYGFFIIFYCMATAVGLLSRLYLPNSSFDPELALPTIALELLSPAMTGLILAGIFSATMSTADSLVLSCSATATHDLPQKTFKKNWQIKLATITVALGALLLALFSKSNVFNLVIMSWAALASAFAPLLIALALGRNPSQTRSLIALSSGLLVAIAWRQLDSGHAIYEGFPGILTGCLILLAFTPGKQRQPFSRQKKTP